MTLSFAATGSTIPGETRERDRLAAPRGRRGTTATWVGTADASWEQLCAGIGSERRVPAGVPLFRQNDPSFEFYRLTKGLVKAAVFTPDGQECLVEIMGPGSVFGDGPAFAAKPRLVTATAVTDIVAQAYPVAAVRALGERRPEVLARLLESAAAKQRSLVQRLVQASTLSAEMRILQLLHRVRAASKGSDVRADALLTHEEVAGYLGLSRITVTRAIGRLRRAGALTS